MTGVKVVWTQPPKRPRASPGTRIAVRWLGAMTPEPVASVMGVGGRRGRNGWRRAVRCADQEAGGGLVCLASQRNCCPDRSKWSHYQEAGVRTREPATFNIRGAQGCEVRLIGVDGPVLGYRERGRRAKLRRRARDRDVARSIPTGAKSHTNPSDPFVRSAVWLRRALTEDSFPWWSTPDGRAAWTADDRARKFERRTWGPCISDHRQAAADWERGYIPGGPMAARARKLSGGR